MRRMRLGRPLALLAVLVAVAGCRAVEVGGPSPETYAVNITNARSQAMTVSFDDGTGPQLLGTVEAGRSERFVVAGARSPTVTIIATSVSGGTTLRQTVTLQAGETVNIKLEP